MSSGRGLLTESEREALSGGSSDNYRYKTKSYLNDRIDKLKEDVEVLQKHDPDSLQRLQSVVCEFGEG